MSFPTQSLSKPNLITELLVADWIGFFRHGLLFELFLPVDANHVVCIVLSQEFYYLVQYPLTDGKKFQPQELSDCITARIYTAFR